MDKKTREAIRKDIEASTIPEELNVLFLLVDAVETMNAQIFERIKLVYKKHGYTIKENELLTGITDYCSMVKKARFHFFERIEPQIQGATYWRNRDEDNPDAPCDTKAYDGFHVASNELIRLVLRYLNACYEDKGAFSAVFRTLGRLPSSGRFKDEDISKYKLK